MTITQQPPEVTGPPAVIGPPPVVAPPAPREVHRDVLIDLMARDERVVCLDSDTGLFAGVDWGAAADRYINLGIAEQNMMSVAAGLARSGRIPYVHTMATFAATRALEQVKLDIAYNEVPVRIVATHGGLSGGHYGTSHHSLEDVGVMRMLPGMTVLVPSDAATTRELDRASTYRPGPVYLRLGRSGTPDLPAGAETPEIGRARSLRAGTDVTLVASGPYPVLAALEAAGDLATVGVSAEVLEVHTVKPLDTEALVAAAEHTTGLVVVEEHWAAGGLGSAVAECVAELGLARPVRRVAVGDHFTRGRGGHRHLLAANGITAEEVAARVWEVLGR
ncbi:transketolase family protein [Paractinoplanes toevensis]|uniref:Transketolase n=1 Tax=Paractinoplanes toevensis TaxID=571911 RepID=A0A919WB73_9ACTN|nr:transketolase C-terminal domain-containing protein [Actinoplanes toevensis]GIM97029.1 transketolase [Actinoplanes toevensis]